MRVFPLRVEAMPSEYDESPGSRYHGRELILKIGAIVIAIGVYRRP